MPQQGTRETPIPKRAHGRRTHKKICREGYGERKESRGGKTHGWRKLKAQLLLQETLEELRRVKANYKKPDQKTTEKKKREEGEKKKKTPFQAAQEDPRD